MIKLKSIVTSFMCMLGTCAGIAQAGNEKPAVFALDAAVLGSNKVRLQAKDAALKPALQRLLRDADTALLFGPVSVMEKTTIPPSGDKHDYMSLAPYFWPDPTKPDGMPYIRKDGQTNPEVRAYKDKEYLPKLCEEVYTLSLAYYFTDNSRYADHAAKLLRVWFLDAATKMNPNLNFGQAVKGIVDGRGAGLIDTRHLVKVVDAIGLLQGAKAWKTADQLGMQQWFSQFLNWMQTSEIGKDEMDAKNNHGVWYDAQRLSFALFTGQQEAAMRIVANAQQRLDMQMNDEGFFPAELARTISLHYSVFVMDPFFVIAEMAKKVNMDLWKYKSPSGKSLEKGFNALLPYLLQDKKWEGQQIKPFDFENTIPLLAHGQRQFDCKRCGDAIKQIGGDEVKKLRINLLTRSDS